MITEESQYVPLRSVIDDSVDEKCFFSQKAVEGMMRNRETMNKGRAQNIDEPCNTVGAHLAKVSLNSTDANGVELLLRQKIEEDMMLIPVRTTFPGLFTLAI